MFLRVLFAILIGYGLGCISFSTLIAKKAAGIDIRQVGSGNAGTTNVLRSLGFKYAALTLAGDLLKGTLAAILGKLIIGWSLDWSIFIGGTAAVLGHNFPVTMGFKGGKGIATTLGALLPVNPLLTLVFLAVGVLANLIIKVYSITSIVGMFVMSFAFTLAAKGYPPQIIAVWFLFVLVVFTHRENLSRLFSGTEKGIDLFK